MGAFCLGDVDAGSQNVPNSVIRLCLGRPDLDGFLIDE